MVNIWRCCWKIIPNLCPIISGTNYDRDTLISSAERGGPCDQVALQNKSLIGQTISKTSVITKESICMYNICVYVCILKKPIKKMKEKKLITIYITW